MTTTGGTVEENLALAETAEGVSDPTLAFNLTGVSNFSPQMPFLDLMKTAREWLGHEEGQWGGMPYEELQAAGVLDENGWPNSIPDGLSKIGLVWDWNDQPLAEDGRKGVYVLTYEGEGTLELGGDATILSQEDGKIVFESVDGNTFSLNILETDPEGTGEYVKDIAIVREDQMELYEAGAIFNPDWLSFVEDSRQFRFMDWMKTNNSTVSEWSDRATVDDYSWKANVPVEIMVRLANETGVDPWFTLPLHATEEYVREFATYVRDNLDPRLKATVELSNETWNWAFQQTRDIRDMMEADWGLSAGHKAMGGYYAKLATEAVLVWDDVFGAESETRLVKVLGTQMADDNRTRKILEAELWFEQEPENAVAPSEVFDAIAVTTYFGNTTMGNEALRDELIAKIADPNVDAAQWFAEQLMDPEYPRSVPQVAALLQEQKDTVSQHGMDLILYEGGQHVHHSFAVKTLTEEAIAALQDFMIDFVRSDHMADLYTELWSAWQDIGDGAFMQFGDVGTMSKWGSTSLLGSLDDSTPRADALTELNETTPNWWGETREEGTFQQGVVREGTDGDDLLIGTREEDYLLGGGGDDVLVGGRGNDGINGGAGHDVLQLNGTVDEYRIEAGDQGYFLIGPDGTDYVTGVEVLMFSDGTQAEVVGEAFNILSGPGGGTEPADPNEVIIDRRGEIFDGTGDGDHATVTIEDGAVDIRAMNASTAAGNILDLDYGASTGYLVTERGTTAAFDGQTVGVNYWSVHENLSAQDGFTLAADVLDATLAFGSVARGFESLAGSETHDRFFGRQADDHFVGRGGNDAMFGGQGMDTLDGGAGDDRVYGGDGWDVALFTGSQTDYDLIEENDGYRITGADGSDFLHGIEELHFSDGSSALITDFIGGGGTGPTDPGTDPDAGTPGDDVLIISSVGEYLDALEGIDIVDVETRPAFAVDDNGTGVTIRALHNPSQLGEELALPAGEGQVYVIHDIHAEAEFDGQSVKASYWSLMSNKAEKDGEALGSSAIETTLQLGSIAMNAEIIVGTEWNDRFYGRGQEDTFHGGDGKDLMIGRTGNDTLQGDGGNDRLIGGAGDDHLRGGEGRDTFSFSVGDGADVIYDLELSDVLDVRDFLFETKEAALATAHDVEGGTVLEFGNGDSVYVIGQNAASLAEIDFLI